MTNNEKLRYSMLIQWSDKDQKYLIRLPEWKHNVQQFVTHGDTYEEAAKNGREVLEMLFENAEGSLPEPRKAEYEWTNEDEELYNASDEETSELIITGSDDDDAERYQISAINKALNKKGNDQDNKNPHTGLSFDDFLKEEDIYEEVVESANERAAALLSRTPIAVAARYDRLLDRIVIDLSNSISVMFRPQDAQGIEQASPEQLSEIEILPPGLALHFPAIDADFYLPSLLEGYLGSRRWTMARQSVTEENDKGDNNGHQRKR